MVKSKTKNKTALAANAARKGTTLSFIGPTPYRNHTNKRVIAIKTTVNKAGPAHGGNLSEDASSLMVSPVFVALRLLENKIIKY